MDAYEIFREYERCLAAPQTRDCFARAEKCRRFVQGDQWHGLNCGDERPPQLNFLTPILKNATALVGQNRMSVRYGALGAESPRRDRVSDICRALDRKAEALWEKLRLDARLWEVLEEAFTTGDAFAYFYDDGGAPALDVLGTDAVLLGDEGCYDVEAQPFVLIAAMQPVERVRAQAEKSGLSEAERARITPDDDPVRRGGCEKVLTLLRLWRGEDGEIRFCRSTRDTVYVPETHLRGLRRYPVARYSWKRRSDTARGAGDIWDKIPNQIAVNKSLYRFECAVKSAAFPHKVYNADALSAEDVRALSYPDSSIAVHDRMGQGVERLVTYLQPADISPHARAIWHDLIAQTRELSGAGDNLENVDPEQASGAAIVAAREAKLLNVNMQVAAFRQFCEEIALIWYEMWRVYDPEGVRLASGAAVSPEELLRMSPEVRVDISPANPYSKLASDSGLRELLASGAITLAEYAEALDDDSAIPKAKLKRILASRGGDARGAARELVRLAGENEALRVRGAKNEQAAHTLVALTKQLLKGETPDGM